MQTKVQPTTDLLCHSMSLKLDVEASQKKKRIAIIKD